VSTNNHRNWPNGKLSERGGQNSKSGEEVSSLLKNVKASGHPLKEFATGILLFTTSGQLLFMNEEAQAFLRNICPPSTHECGGGLIPAEVHALVRELAGHLERCTHPKDCESIQLERIYMGSVHRMLIRGLCVPDEPMQQNSRFLIIIEPFAHQVEGLDAEVQERYHLTEREQMVVIYLMLGFTNKEIASRINLSEYTVKEHLKRIMHKTRTTTRTGLLARMVFPTPDKNGQAAFPDPIESHD
jgi:DNA-binding CsgD family transcriptional regulator